MSKGPSAKDPRYRPFRAAMYTLYMVLVAVISVPIVVNVTRSVIAMTPSPKPDTEPTLTVRECLDIAEGLWRELDDHRKSLTEQPIARRADDAWTLFRVNWLQRKRDAESRCALRSRSRADLNTAYRRLERVMELYTIHATQYAGEIGASVDALRTAMERARKDPAAGRLP